jgi:hypothetical protein
MKKLVCLAWIAAAVGGVLGAQASSATAAAFDSEAEHVTIAGASAMVITVDPGTVTLKASAFHGTWLSFSTSCCYFFAATFKEVTLHTIFGPISPTANMNGCSLEVNANGPMHLSCPAGKSFVISGPGCTITIPAQTFSNAASYTNTGSGSSRDIDMTTKVSGLQYSYTGFTCGSGSSTTNGTWTGTTTLRGSSSGGSSVGIWHTS